MARAHPVTAKLTETPCWQSLEIYPLESKGSKPSLGTCLTCELAASWPTGFRGKLFTGGGPSVSFFCKAPWGFQGKLVTGRVSYQQHTAAKPPAHGKVPHAADHWALQINCRSLMKKTDWNQKGKPLSSPVLSTDKVCFCASWKNILIPSQIIQGRQWRVDLELRDSRLITGTGMVCLTVNIILTSYCIKQPHL